MRVLVLVGVPGSGKSTLSAMLRQESSQPAHGDRQWEGQWEVVCQDELGSRDACVEAAARHLRAGRRVLVDRSNFDRDQRRHWTALATRERLPAAAVGAVLLDVPVAECVRRVQGRVGHKTLVDKGGSSAPIVRRFGSMLVPPSAREGFGAGVWVLPGGRGGRGGGAEAGAGGAGAGAGAGDPACADCVSEFVRAACL
jgi:predicted kinase